MSSNDKTRQKLMESMRKTRASSNEKTEQEKSNVKSQQKKPVKKKSIKKTRVKPTRISDKVAVDSYQSGRRVWPD